jgi:hypothetical protein
MKKGEKISVTTIAPKILLKTKFDIVNFYPYRSRTQRIKRIKRIEKRIAITMRADLSAWSIQ